MLTRDEEPMRSNDFIKRGDTSLLAMNKEAKPHDRKNFLGNGGVNSFVFLSINNLAIE
ncbi:hypothetical protein SAMN05421780_10234 [Flexibacter flexilis DSM 6793]|uniref:Uncharacterized protein n=1 Tax=Flexibacter flexilis DSM 6793 TaxID=927664 RepID=A0A1I1F3P6_9BACT|nr:hypothetical protein [Flexibacter flexilis]SFB93891.1 hypothetical protein SAMN05421780_10234 [Flexibacter flexilis DSM 6793]